MVSRREELEEVHGEIATCTKCRLHETRNHTVPGEGPPDADLLILGMGPGKDEDASGRPFVGRAGEKLDETMELVGIAREEVFITNSVKCLLPDNRNPRRDEMEACRPFLEAQLDIVKPKVICLLGNVALQQLLGERGITRHRGKLHWHQEVPTWPTYHPAALLYNPELQAPFERDFQELKELYDQVMEGSSELPRQTTLDDPAW